MPATGVGKDKGGDVRAIGHLQRFDPARGIGTLNRQWSGFEIRLAKGCRQIDGRTQHVRAEQHRYPALTRLHFEIGMPGKTAVQVFQGFQFHLTLEFIHRGTPTRMNPHVGARLAAIEIEAHRLTRNPGGRATDVQTVFREIQDAGELAEDQRRFR